VKGGIRFSEEVDLQEVEGKVHHSAISAARLSKSLLI
jgi:hypothetical protein